MLRSRPLLVRMDRSLSWPGDGAVAGRATCHHPGSLAGRNRPFLALLRVFRKKNDGLKNAYCKRIFQVFQMFQRYIVAFHADVVKIDRDIIMVVHVCCKLMFTMFYLFFQTYVVSVFIWMLHIFHTHVSSVLSGCCICFSMVSSVFASVFRCMFQVFHLPSDVCCKCCI